MAAPYVLLLYDYDTIKWILGTMQHTPYLGNMLLWFVMNSDLTKEIKRNDVNMRGFFLLSRQIELSMMVEKVEWIFGGLEEMVLDQAVLSALCVKP